MNTTFAKLETAIPITLSLWNQRQQLEFIGRTMITPSTLQDIDNEEMGNEIEMPQWHPIKVDDNDTESVGRVLCSFRIVDLDFELIEKDQVVFDHSN